MRGSKSYYFLIKPPRSSFFPLSKLQKETVQWSETGCFFASFVITISLEMLKRSHVIYGSTPIGNRCIKSCCLMGLRRDVEQESPSPLGYQ
jgi:hypothetical protein